MQTLHLLSPEEVLECLGKALLAERQAVVDYGAHAMRTSNLEMREALQTLQAVEREHAARLLHRITILGGSPPDQAPYTPANTEDIGTQLRQDLAGEQWAIVEYARLVATVTGDDETVELLTELLMDEIRHARWLKETLRDLEVGGRRNSV